MSTRPRPRPRPVPATKPATTANGAASSSSTGAPNGTVNVVDEDSLFMRNQSRDLKTWKKLDAISRENEVTVINDSDSDSDRSPKISPRRKKKNKDEQSMPAWTKTMRAVSMMSEDDEEDFLRRLEGRPEDNSDDDEIVIQESKKRPRSRSRSLTPPPALPQHALMTARQTIRELVGLAPRAESPTWNAGDESADTIVLAPELAEISRQVRNERKHGISDQAHQPVDGGGPEFANITVHWRSHPLNPNGTTNSWKFKIKRRDMFREIFNEIADVAGILSDNLIITSWNSRVYPSATPQSIGVWTEGELQACDKMTYDYLREQRRQRSESVEPVMQPASSDPHETGEDDSPESEAESTSGGETFRLTLRSAKTKDIVLTVRQTTTCGAIVKAFLKKAGLSDQYPLASPTKRGAAKNASNAVAPCLMVDGDRMKSESAIGDADLEDGDQVEVVGL